ncbi:MAG: hypothetical protein ACYC0Q_01785 [Eubacteriales bacterium]
MKCARCKEEIEAEDRYDYLGQTLCEDCYMDALQPPRPCDPTAVSSAMHTRRQLGQTGTQGLNEMQKKIYDYLKEKGKVEREELLKVFGLPQWEMEKQIAVLRHCELVRAIKEGNKVYMTTF